MAGLNHLQDYLRNLHRTKSGMYFERVKGHVGSNVAPTKESQLSEEEKEKIRKAIRKSQRIDAIKSGIAFVVSLAIVYGIYHFFDAT